MQAPRVYHNPCGQPVEYRLGWGESREVAVFFDHQTDDVIECCPKCGQSLSLAVISKELRLNSIPLPKPRAPRTSTRAIAARQARPLIAKAKCLRARAA